MPRGIYDKSRGLCLSRQLSWTHGCYAPIQASAKANTKAGKDERRRPPGQPLKVLPKK